MIEDTNDPNIFLIDGVENYDEEGMVLYLLQKGRLLCNGRKYLDEKGVVYPETIVLFLICNDTFGWACADAEEIAYNELPELYKAVKADERYGDTKWVCKKRNLQPQQPLIEIMKEAGVWDEAMEALPKNEV